MQILGMQLILWIFGISNGGDEHGVELTEIWPTLSQVRSYGKLDTHSNSLW